MLAILFKISQKTSAWAKATLLWLLSHPLSSHKLPNWTSRKPSWRYFCSLLVYWCWPYTSSTNSIKPPKRVPCSIVHVWVFIHVGSVWGLVVRTFCIFRYLYIHPHCDFQMAEKHCFLTFNAPVVTFKWLKSTTFWLSMLPLWLSMLPLWLSNDWNWLYLQHFSYWWTP